MQTQKTVISIIYIYFWNWLTKTWYISITSIYRSKTNIKQLHLICRELCTSCTACRSYSDLLMSQVIFAVNRSECFMEKRNIIRTLWGWISLKKTIEPYQIPYIILLVLIKKRGRFWMSSLSILQQSWSPKLTN